MDLKLDLISWVFVVSKNKEIEPNKPTIYRSAVGNWAYDMSIMISITHTQHVQYDIADMLTIVCPTTVPGGRTILTTIDSSGT